MQQNEHRTVSEILSRSPSSWGSEDWRILEAWLHELSGQLSTCGSGHADDTDNVPLHECDLANVEAYLAHCVDMVRKAKRREGRSRWIDRLCHVPGRLWTADARNVFWDWATEKISMRWIAGNLAVHLDGINRRMTEHEKKSILCEAENDVYLFFKHQKELTEKGKGIILTFNPINRKPIERRFQSLCKNLGIPQECRRLVYMAERIKKRALADTESARKGRPDRETAVTDLPNKSVGEEHEEMSHEDILSAAAFSRGHLGDTETEYQQRIDDTKAASLKNKCIECETTQSYNWYRAFIMHLGGTEYEIISSQLGISPELARQHWKRGFDHVVQCTRQRLKGSPPTCAAPGRSASTSLTENRNG